MPPSPMDIDTLANTLGVSSDVAAEAKRPHSVNVMIPTVLVQAMRVIADIDPTLRNPSDVFRAAVVQLLENHPDREMVLRHAFDELAVGIERSKVREAASKRDSGRLAAARKSEAKASGPTHLEPDKVEVKV